MKTYYQEIIDLLKQKNLTLSTCESITGGMISSMLIEVSGASEVFKGAFVTYTDESKINIANVNLKTIKKYGVISKETVLEMAINTQKKFRSDISISITGNAGPKPTENKPIGFSHLAISVIDKTYLYELQATVSERNDIRIETTALVMKHLIKLLQELKP